jgi:hypothetical protein
MKQAGARAFEKEIGETIFLHEPHWLLRGLRTKEAPMPIDPFELYSDSLTAPAKTAFAVTPNDTADLPMFAKAIYIGTGGDLVLRAVDSVADATFANLPDGTILPVRVRAIRATGSTAANIVGLS